MKGTNTLLVGATGSGKSHCLRTLVTDCGLETFTLMTEPSHETWDGNNKFPALTCEAGAHYHYVPPANPGWDAMIDSAEKINTMSFEMLAKLEHINKRDYSQFVEVLKTCNNFVCDRCEQSFGSVDSWDSSRAFATDSLSGLNIMAMDLVTGSKPVKSMANWGVAMDNLERLVNMLCSSTSCYFVLTAHLERELDETAGTTTLMASTLGKKLAPRLPRFFSDVVLCSRDGDKFRWSTAAANVDLKSRTLPLSDDLKPTFKQVMQQQVQAEKETAA